MQGLLQRLQDIRYSLWLIPTAMVAAGIALALLAIDADTRIGEDTLSRWPLLFGASADGARALLQMVSGAMITVAGLTFSITVLVLSLGASQYTPRVIRTFMGNRATQSVLGVFVGIFAYCLVVLRATRGSGETFVPSVAIALAVVLALLGVAVLVYFIHHVATSIQASSIVASVTADAIRVIDSMYLECGPGPDRNPTGGEDRRHSWYAVVSLCTGYLRSIDIDGLGAYALAHGIVVRMERKIGEFVIERGLLLSVSSRPDEAMARALSGYFAIGHYRTVEQDVSVGIQQLIDIALHALSPGINDTTTGLLCIDYLSAILMRLAPLQVAPQDCSRDGRVLVIRRGPDFSQLLDAACEPLRHNARENLAVYRHLLRALETVGCAVRQPGRLDAVCEQLKLTAEYARRNIQAPDQRAQLERLSGDILKRLQLMHRGATGGA
ncbi:MAG TPA: DUF2254 domain-containing protein [Noviherbaspirillum sp.]|nr:DUF2254 domain-containing protein [Noviherbaspirillum sp.]